MKKERERESEFIWANGAIMESLCLVKSHEITRVTAGMYSAAERERGRWFNSTLALVSVASFCVYEIKALTFLGDQSCVSVPQILNCSLCNLLIKCMFKKFNLVK